MKRNERKISVLQLRIDLYVCKLYIRDKFPSIDKKKAANLAKPETIADVPAGL